MKTSLRPYLAGISHTQPGATDWLEVSVISVSERVLYLYSEYPFYVRLRTFYCLFCQAPLGQDPVPSCCTTTWITYTLWESHGDGQMPAISAYVYKEISPCSANGDDYLSPANHNHLIMQIYNLRCQITRKSANTCALPNNPLSGKGSCWADIYIQLADSAWPLAQYV